jgi:ATP phosphoribosyltransferase
MTDLILALPSKGRLQEQALDYLAQAGLALVRSGGARDYTARLKGAAGVTVSLLSAAEIAEELIAGRIHLGVTGEDLLAEQDAGTRIAIIERLGFGRANVVVAVPRCWIDVDTMSDLDDVAASFHARHRRKLRVATKFVGLARRFFASHGISDYRIIESLGATEGAPAAGTAELIVDITTTGATLAANELKILDDGIILESQALLAASTRAAWPAQVRHAAQALLDRMGASVLARASRLVDLPGKSPDDQLLLELETRFKARRMNAGQGAGAALLVPETHVEDLIDFLRTQAPGTLFTLHKPTQVFAPGNALAERLAAALPHGLQAIAE